MKPHAIFTAAIAAAAAPAWAGSEQAKQAGNPQPQDQARAVVVGEVVDERNVTIQGPAGDQHQLYKVRTAAGNTLIVDVGQTPSNAETPALQKGDRVMAIGSKARINGRPVLFARYYGESYSAGMGAEQQSRQFTTTSGASQ